MYKLFGYEYNRNYNGIKRVNYFLFKTLSTEVIVVCLVHTDRYLYAYVILTDIKICYYDQSHNGVD